VCMVNGITFFRFYQINRNRIGKVSDRIDLKWATEHLHGCWWGFDIGEQREQQLAVVIHGVHPAPVSVSP